MLNRVDLIIRSHEPVTAGFEWFDSGHLVTVFSATNYTGYDGNRVSYSVRLRVRLWLGVRFSCDLAVLSSSARSNFGAFLLIDNTLKVCSRCALARSSRSPA